MATLIQYNILKLFMSRANIAGTRYNIIIILPTYTPLRVRILNVYASGSCFLQILLCLW